MIVHNVEQGSRAWLDLRLGVPTASEFHKIVTPTGKLSSQARGYAFRLVTERLLRRSLDSLDHLEHIARGKEVEPQAVRMYEFEAEVETLPVGFITSDDGRMGCSPDRLIVGRNAGLEVKCPAPWTHVEYMLDGFGKDYVPQVQGQMLVAGFEYVDRYSFHPEMPPARYTTRPDKAFQDTLRGALAEFCDMKDGLLEKVRASGFFEERERMQTALDAQAAELASREWEREWFGDEP